MGSNNNWTLMATHGVVLFYIVANPESTMREMADALGITERRVAQVVRDLAEARLIHVRREGRRNSYSVDATARFRHPTLSHIPLGAFAAILAAKPDPGADPDPEGTPSPEP